MLTYHSSPKYSDTLTLKMLDVFTAHSSPICSQLTCRLPIICMCFQNRVENSVNPDQLASVEPADLDLNCFQNRIYPGFTVYHIKNKHPTTLNFPP